MPDKSITFTGGDALERKLLELAHRLGKPGSLRVGFLEGSTEADGTSIPMIAAIHEYGAPAAGIPARPYFRPMINDAAPKMAKNIEAGLKRTDYDVEKTLALVGEWLGGKLRDSIIAVNSPALSPVTLLLRERFGNHPERITFADVMKARGDIKSGTKPNVTATQAKPLIWTGTMLNSIEYEVETDGSSVERRKIHE